MHSMYIHYLLATFACKIMIKLYWSIFVSRCSWDEEKSICVNTARRRRRCCPSWLRAVAVHWSLRRHRQDLKQWLQQRTLLTGRRQWRGNTTESNEIVSLVLCVYWPRFYAILSCQSEKKTIHITITWAATYVTGFFSFQTEASSSWASQVPDDDGGLSYELDYMGLDDVVPKGATLAALRQHLIFSSEWSLSPK